MIIVSSSQVITRWDNAVTLSLPVRHLSLVVNDDITSLADSLGANNSLHGNDFADEGLLGLEQLHWDVLLFPVRISFQVVLSFRGRFGEGGAV
jgi:hypothetical protein